MALSFACANNKNTTKNTPETNLSVNEISLSRTGCFGTCPIYELTIQANGNVSYFGKAYIENVGEYEGQIDSKRTADLFEKINTYKWESYPEKYPIDNVDFPQFKLSYSSKDISKTIIGNSNADKKLIALAKELDDFIQSIKLSKIKE